MDDNMIRARVHHAVQQHCAASGVQPNPYLARRVLAAANEKGEGTVKRKLSVGLIVAIVLMLATVTAVAVALLSVRQLVNDYAIPMAQESIGETDYSPEEVSILVQLAQENGIVLSEQALSNIAWAETLGEGYAKDEFIKELASAEFGGDISTWTLEQQKWYDDALVAMGLFPENQKALPEDPDSAQNLAVSRAVAHLTQHYALSGDITDASQYHVGVQYINGDADGDYPGLYWSIDFQPKTITGGEYWVYLRDDGEILGQAVRPGLSADSNANDIYHAYGKLYSSWWEQSVYQSFIATIRQMKPTNERSYLCLMQTAYPDVPDDAISIDEAYAIAAADLGVTSYRVFNHPLIATDTNPVWKLRFYKGDETYSFEIDCITGEIRTKRLLDNAHRSWWMSMVLWEVSDEVDANWVDVRPSFG